MSFFLDIHSPYAILYEFILSIVRERRTGAREWGAKTKKLAVFVIGVFPRWVTKRVTLLRF